MIIPALCRCDACRNDALDQYLKAKADEARLLLAPMLEAAGRHEDAQAQRDWALAIYPTDGRA